MKVNPRSVSSLSLQGGNQYGLGLTNYGYFDGYTYYDGGYGGYWLANGNMAPVNFVGDNIGVWAGSDGNYGYSVRCVKDRMDQESIVSDYVNHSDGYCPDTLACNFSPYTASTGSWPNPYNNCLIENQPCNDGFENSVNDTAVGCKCIGDFGTVMGDTIVDVDGNRYSTVEIGSQTWMQSNLRTTRDREGNLIDSVYQHGDAVLDSLLGVYYHFAPIYMEGNNYCPIGWHIPTFNDWYVLFDHIGSVLQVPYYYPSEFFGYGGEITKKQWGPFQSWNRYAANSLSLDILPNGKLLNMSGVIESLGSEANLWCWPGYIVHWSDKHHFVGTQNSNFNEQLGIRCIKDN
jgi:uncharacterized protein (TIGR02145 family)